MADKKAAGKKPRSRFSVATRLLGSELRATLQAPKAEERQIPKGKGRRKK